MQETYRAIYRHALFKELERKRGRFSWTLTGVVLLAYFAFVLAVAFVPEVLAVPIRAGSAIAWGIPIGIAIIVLSFALTGLYVHRSNTTFDPLTRKLLIAVRDLPAEGGDG